MENEELNWFYQMLLAGPGMDESVKHNFTLSRSLTLLLAEMIDNGLKERKGQLIACIPNQMIEEMGQLRINLLEKSNLLKLTEQLAKKK